MKRFHVHVAVADLSASIRYYSALFAAEPTTVKSDYAKWALDDPRVSFAISVRGTSPDKLGVDHLGIQVETDEELAEMQDRLVSASLPLQKQSNTTCCYAKSDKYWSVDPQGVAWESFQTLESAPTYGQSRQATDSGGVCCTPVPSSFDMEPKVENACCKPGSACC
ncbi:ArsI/CadI family heavy metal resistance metalloenzyme [Castellaniella sp. S9]|uniref:ArsI/CadI family heavy metal resistance metalloenzyme n=1 Tax=Castellaniella sp. S9 TaxID=2993652 RepID=UPI0022B32CF4|nr:ArsI/CadI family heavy metal resistance metalloenzyme [Castellaniella sp. S9]